ncbi:hypothetical protein TNCV_3453611 [Trichonephila clavipes]|nr:hypothetical protein TNCV_3453611 [Trichonephila clavipes]
MTEYEFTSKYRLTCVSAKNELDETTAEYDTWYSGYKNCCQIKRIGTLRITEMKAEAKLWSRSEVSGFKYLTLLSDGDAKTHESLNCLKYMDQILKLLKESALLM